MAKNDAVNESGNAAEGTVDTIRRLSDDELRSIERFEDAFAAASLVTLGGEVVDASQEIGNGFTLLPSEGKRQLIGRETMFVEWDFHKSDTVTNEDGSPAEFVSVRAVCKAGKAVEKFIVNDGSTGIYAQLRAFTDRTGKLGGLYSKRGLRVSQYEYNGGQAETYYIDTSA